MENTFLLLLLWWAVAVVWALKDPTARSMRTFAGWVVVLVKLLQVSLVKVLPDGRSEWSRRRRAASD